jgi:PiT family inorganic phosphate transporter
MFGQGVNWDGVRDTALSLLISPIIGFVIAGGLLVLAKLVIKYPKLFEAPPEGQPPPWHVRGVLFLTCTGVSFAHGSNDGQKGMGLVMLILVGVLPELYAVDISLKANDVASLEAMNRAASAIIDKRAGPSAPVKRLSNSGIRLLSDPPAADMETVLKASSGDDKNEAVISDYINSSSKLDRATYAAVSVKNKAIATVLGGKQTLSDLPAAARTALRTDTYLVSNALKAMLKDKAFSGADLPLVTSYQKKLDSITKYIPLWVKIGTALALGIGTMVGYKRIVKTVGEKIGKAHLTYGQGASAEIVAYATIQGADIFGLPVSTTHVLSSGVAGTMVANHSGVDSKTLRDIGLARVLTLPVCVFFGSMIFAGGLLVVVRLGAK